MAASKATSNLIRASIRALLDHVSRSPPALPNNLNHTAIQCTNWPKFAYSEPFLFLNGGRQCHGSAASPPHDRHTRKRLGLRIISCESEAQDVFDQLFINEKADSTRDARYGFSGHERNRNYAGVKYSVIRVNMDGTLEPLVLHTTELGVQAKDLDLLAGNFFIPKRSAIALRGDQILLRMENVRALICKDHCLLFDAHRPRKGSFQSSTLEGDATKRVSEASHEAREAFAIFMAEHARQLAANPKDQVPFHLRMIECLLDETCTFFHQKVERLKLVLERTLEELTNDVDMGGLQRLLPLKRAMTEIEHDVRDTHEAMDQVIGSDDMLDALCLKGEEQLCNSQGEMQNSSLKKEQPTNKIRQAATEMIVSCQREIDDAGGALEEMKKDMDSAQEVWELGLDTTRNRIITMNLYISIATVSLSLATVPASFFGMNLISGLEDRSHIFYWVIASTSSLAMTLCLGLIFAFRIWPHFKDKRRAQDLTALRELLQHMDVIDDVFQSVASQGGGAHISRDKFEEILRAHSSTQFIRKRELDLIFRMFDRNRNKFLESTEWNSSAQRRIRPRVTQYFGRDME